MAETTAAARYSAVGYRAVDNRPDLTISLKRDLRSTTVKMDVVENDRSRQSLAQVTERQRE
ncbi:unnamed protein product [Fusarium graminearum]|uniref:Uncharacterized protein n=1 Tax=Gibberella zeae TaxID=5518 RepID=A0A4E9EGD0_GIBZA|nr:unnamed protein product [Fusarium graminearum]CAF3586569.1 unnamed protein product [Fusarium graminearum]CAG1987213.1 unnamed protein product [Fusarium graminearum]CAG1999878.1 unnamed protein product [Fusarium graminearum]